MPRFHIVQFMSVIVITAIAVLIVGRPAEAVVVIPIIVGLMIVGAFISPLIPGSLESVMRRPPADLDTHIAAIERALTYRSVIRFGPLFQARFKLMQLYKLRGRFDDAIAEAKELLARYRARGSFESQIHLEIAACHDSLGRADESKAEQRRAGECLPVPPRDALGWLVQGRLFAAKDRHDLAIAAYERALKSFSLESQQIRTEARILLAIACLHAGRFEDAIKWAEFSLKNAKAVSRAYLLARVAGNAASRLGRSGEAEEYFRQACKLAVEANDKKGMADSLAALAELERSRGNLAQALSLCLEAESLSPEGARDAFLVHASVCRNQGRPDEAIERATQAGQAGMLPSSSAERRMQAIVKLQLAHYRGDAGQIDQAWDELGEAKAELGHDRRLSSACEVVSIRLTSMRGERALTLGRAEALLRALEGLALGPGERSNHLATVGRSLLDAGEYERAIDCLERVAAESSHRINQPLGYYYVGECRRGQGDLARALDAYKRAAGFGIDSHHARLAGEAIRELAAQEPRRNNMIDSVDTLP
jgi:tetratricopeptide (TPR) repeat protein